MQNKSIVVLIMFSVLMSLWFTGCNKDGVSDGMNGSKNSDRGQSACSEVSTKVGTYYDFNKIREELGGTYCLTSDIDFKGRTDFEPIGILRRPFTGVLDGAGHKIKNVKIEKEGSSYVGVIGNAKGATIKNLVVKDIIIKGKDRVGFIGGMDGGTISEVYVNGWTIEGSSSRGTDTGGLVGENEGTIKNSYAIVKVSGFLNVGGLVGFNKGSIENSYGMIKVSGFLNVGGLVGENVGSIKNSYARGGVKSNSGGGLVGNNRGTIKNSYATVAIVSKGVGGGLVERRSKGAGITNSYFDKGTSIRTVGVGVGSNVQVIGVSKGVNIVKRGKKYYDSKGTASEGDDVEIFKGWDFASVWDFEASVWPKLKWQKN